MSAAAVCLTTIVAIVAFGTAVGFIAGVHRKMDLEQWTVGGRGFGTLLVFLLMAGEAYTTFSLLGASGWIYSRGAPTLYVLAYITLAYVVSFFILPPIWELGRRHGLQTHSDFFNLRYGNRYLAAFDAHMVRKKKLSAEYKTERRRVIENTFRWLGGLAETHWS